MDWNPEGENRIPWPKGIAEIHSLAAYPVIYGYVEDKAKTRPCPVCSTDSTKRALAQKKLIEKLDAGNRVLFTLGAEEQGGEIKIPPVHFQPGLRVTGVRVFFRLAPDGQWLPCPGGDLAIPGALDAVKAGLDALNEELRHQHALISKHPGHAAVTE